MQALSAHTPKVLLSVYNYSVNVNWQLGLDWGTPSRYLASAVLPVNDYGCYMQVVAEVYAAQDVVVKPHILLSLVLYKIVDPAQVISSRGDCCQPSGCWFKFGFRSCFSSGTPVLVSPAPSMLKQKPKPKKLYICAISTLCHERMEAEQLLQYS